MASIEDFFDGSVDVAVREVVEAFSWTTISGEDVARIKQAIVDVMWSYRPEEET